MTEVRKILVPVDFSDCSRVALDYARDLAQKLGARLHLLHVWEMPPYIPWAWGINGCASVLSALLAGLLSVHLGYSTVLLLAAALYAAAVLAWRI